MVNNNFQKHFPPNTKYRICMYTSLGVYFYIPSINEFQIRDKNNKDIDTFIEIKRCENIFEIFEKKLPLLKDTLRARYEVPHYVKYSAISGTVVLYKYNGFKHELDEPLVAVRFDPDTKDKVHLYLKFHCFT